MKDLLITDTKVIQKNGCFYNLKIRYGLKNINDNVVLEPKFTHHVFKNGVHLFAEDKIDNKYLKVVFYDKNAKRIGSTYDFAYPFNENNLAVVGFKDHKDTEKIGVLTIEGNLVSVNKLTLKQDNDLEK